MATLIRPARSTRSGSLAAYVRDHERPLTWYAGIPSSSSHALIGGLLGAGLAKAGLSAVVWHGVIATTAAIVLSPALGFVLALLLVLGVSWTFVRSTPGRVDRLFPSLQFPAQELTGARSRSG